LFAAVNLDASTWTLMDNRVELTLNKVDDGRMWTEIVRGDDRGEFAPDPELVQEFHQRLIQLQSQSQNNPANSESQNNPAYNAQGLEDCDAPDAETGFLEWWDGDSHEIICEADIGGRQWLFTVQLEADEMPAMCLRHDVDGIVWRVDSDPTQKPCWQHYATFNAFGYVEASKEQRRFNLCPPDFSYALIVDCVKHAYVYWQPSEYHSELRNRKSKNLVEKVAKQQLISLGPTGTEKPTGVEIIGAAATNETVFLMTKDTLYAVAVKSK